MSRLNDRVKKLETSDASGDNRPCFILHVLNDGQVFNSTVDAFFPSEETFLSAIGKKRSEVILLPHRHDCTGEEFLASRQRAKAAALLYQPGEKALALMADKGVSREVAIHLERMEIDPSYDREACHDFYRSL